MSRSYFINVTWLIHQCDMTHSYVWHDSFICETRLLLPAESTNLQISFSQKRLQISGSNSTWNRILHALTKHQHAHARTQLRIRHGTHIKKQKKRIHKWYNTAEEVSWMRLFDPVSRLLFDLFHSLWTKVLFRFVPLTCEPESICASIQWTGSTPAGFQELFRAATFWGNTSNHNHHDQHAHARTKLRIHDGTHPSHNLRILQLNSYPFSNSPFS